MGKTAIDKLSTYDLQTRSKTDIQKLAKQKVQQLAENVEELEKVLQEEETPKTLDKSLSVVQKQLTATMTKILKTPKVSTKDLDRLIEIVTVSIPHKQTQWFISR